MVLFSLLPKTQCFMEIQKVIGTISLKQNKQTNKNKTKSKPKNKQKQKRYGIQRSHTKTTTICSGGCLENAKSKFKFKYNCIQNNMHSDHMDNCVWVFFQYKTS